MRLLHISDIHLKDPLCHGPEDPELHFREELVMHAGTQAGDFGDIDALLVTGDIAFKGDPKEYEAASNWLEHLANAVGCTKRRIYVVPGNHDVDRTTFDRTVSARNAVRAISLAGNNDAREAEMNTQLGADDSAKSVFVSLSAYNGFAAKYDCQLYPGRLYWRQELRLNDQTILRLHGLNSTLISGVDGNDDAPGRLFMGPRQLNVSRAPGVVNLAMAHHPPEWMSDQADVESRLLGAPNIVLFGHRHIQKIIRDVDGHIMFSAGSVNPERHEKGWEPAYNLIQIDVEDGDGRRNAELVVRQFHWQSNPSGFVAKINTANDEPFFRHIISVDGTNEAGSSTSVDEKGGAEMHADSDENNDDTPTLSAPNIRDLIYRFWELGPGQRQQVMRRLGIEIPDDPENKEFVTYRAALVDLTRSGKLDALESAIAEKEVSR